jgi:hypothetical protein
MPEEGLEPPIRPAHSVDGVRLRHDSPRRDLVVGHGTIV